MKLLIPNFIEPVSGGRPSKDTGRSRDHLKVSVGPRKGIGISSCRNLGLSFCLFFVLFYIVYSSFKINCTGSFLQQTWYLVPWVVPTVDDTLSTDSPYTVRPTLDQVVVVSVSTTTTIILFGTWFSLPFFLNSTFSVTLVMFTTTVVRLCLRSQCRSSSYDPPDSISSSSIVT